MYLNEMQAIVFLLIMLPLSLATEVFIYDWNNYRDIRYGQPLFRSAAPWKFFFNYSDQLYMVILYWNTSKNVTHTFESGLKLAEESTVTLTSGQRYPMYVYQLIGLDATLYLNLYTSHRLCRSIRIAEGRHFTTLRREQIGTEYKYPDICLRGKTNPCVLGVYIKDVKCESFSNGTQKHEDLKTTTPLTSLENHNNRSSNVKQMDEDLKAVKPLTSVENNNTKNNHQQNPLHNVLLYVIPSVVGTCVVILVIYVTVKKFCLHKSHPGETMELNTCATAGEIVYANLDLMQEDSRPPKPEESAYAEIIGVLHPH